MRLKLFRSFPSLVLGGFLLGAAVAMPIVLHHHAHASAAFTVEP